MPEIPDWLTLPTPFDQLQAPGEPLTTVRFLDTMEMLLEQCHGLASVAYMAAASPAGPPRGLADALFVLDEYTGAALDLFEYWKEQARDDDSLTEENRTDD
jgi:hypothetical protein